eukprot:996920-Amphidinium_carterae.1
MAADGSSGESKQCFHEQDAPPHALRLPGDILPGRSERPMQPDASGCLEHPSCQHLHPRVLQAWPFQTIF